MYKFILSAAVALGLVSTSANAAENPLIGAVNFNTCITDSKAGRKEQESMESLRKQMSSTMESMDRELKEIATKFEDSEYLDSLSPKAEEELKTRYQALQEEMGRNQSQFYQMLNHAQMQSYHRMNSTIAKAAEKIASEKGLDYVMNKDVCFYIRPDLDVTVAVIDEMDKTYDAEVKNIPDSKEAVPFDAEEAAALEQAD